MSSSRERRGGGKFHSLVRSKHDGVVGVGVGVGCGDGCGGGRSALVVRYSVGQLDFAHEAGYVACGEVRDRGAIFRRGVVSMWLTSESKSESESGVVVSLAEWLFASVHIHLCSMWLRFVVCDVCVYL